MTDEDSTIGFVGLGMMGLPMASRLVHSGRRVIGFDINQPNLERASVEGVVPCSSLGELATLCHTIILMLPNSDVVEGVLRQMLVEGEPRRVSTVIDMSSSVPARTRGLAGLLQSQNIAFLDAPVSGGVARAKSGTLTVMIGGDSDVASTMMPVLSSFGNAQYVGPPGSGHAAKALNNLLSATHLLASNAAALAAKRLGIDPLDFLGVVNGSSGRSGSTEAKLPSFVLPGTFDSGFTADLMEKDISIACALLEELGLETPVTGSVREEWTELNAKLSAGADHTEIIRPLEDRAGVVLRAAHADASC